MEETIFRRADTIRKHDDTIRKRADTIFMRGGNDLRTCRHDPQARRYLHPGVAAPSSAPSEETASTPLQR